MHCPSHYGVENCTVFTCNYCSKEIREHPREFLGSFYHSDCFKRIRFGKYARNFTAQVCHTLSPSLNNELIGKDLSVVINFLEKGRQMLLSDIEKNGPEGEIENKEVHLKLLKHAEERLKITESDIHELDVDL